MKIHGQRWRYRIGNALIDIDNAFSWSGWTQERLVVNAETVQEASAWFAFRRAFDEPWLTLVGEDELKVRLRSRLWGIVCEATLADDPVEPEGLFEAGWTGGRKSWPGEAEWKETDQFGFGLE